MAVIRVHNRKMKISRHVKLLMIIGFLMLALILGHLVVPVKAWSGAVYILYDGSVDPPSAPIIRSGDLYNVYTLTENIYSSSGIVIGKGNIVVDGAGYTLQGVEGADTSRGIEIGEIWGEM
jgi:hypothetical protein